MKLPFLLGALTVSAFSVGFAQAACGDYTKQDCPDVPGCSLTGSGNNIRCVGTEQIPALCTLVGNAPQCHNVVIGGKDCSWEGNTNSGHCDDPPVHPHVECHLRPANGNGDDCEYDDLCIFSNYRGNKTCSEVDLGTGVDGDVCASKLVPDDVFGDYYVAVEDQGCAPGFICTVNNTALGVGYYTAIPGVCQNTTCLGKKVPGNCNGNIDNKEQCESATSRVTICHRTCSRTNPWVRITIDEDAWDGEGCGHQQHDIRDECSNKAPWSEWGPNRRDYLLVRHGTRADVAKKYNPAEEKAYWRKWERACPYVRNGKCCNWGIDDPNDPDYSPCCGVAPELACEFPMGETDETICPGHDAVGSMGYKTGSSSGDTVPAGMDPTSMVYDLKFIDAGTVAPQVSFKINSPFEFSVDTYIQHHKKAANSVGGALDPACIGKPLKTACDSSSESITAGCIIPFQDEPPFTIITVFFVSSNTDVFGSGGGSAVEPYECCPIPDGDLNSKKIIEYNFKIMCDCPMEVITDHDRNLRGMEEATQRDLDAWYQAVGTGTQRTN